MRPANTFEFVCAVEKTANEIIIDFDTTYTRISADATSSYFNIYMNGLEPERYYKLLFKVILGGSTQILDDSYYFKGINK